MLIKKDTFLLGIIFQSHSSIIHIAYMDESNIIYCLTISQEITDGISKSAQALQAAETGIRHIGSVAQKQTICMYNVVTIAFQLKPCLHKQFNLQLIT